MKLTALTFLATLAAATAFSATNDVVRPVRRQSGGMLMAPRRNARKVYVVNAQSRVKESVIDEFRQKFVKAIRTPIEMTSGTFAFANPKIDGELSLYVIDDAAMPVSLIAPEGRWAFVNVAQLAKGRGEKEAFLEARTRKELARIASMLFGGIGSSYKDNLLSPITDIEKLDEHATDSVPVDALMRCSVYLTQLGVPPYRMLPYRAAVLGGWAPAPTNDIQKAIWDEVHAAPKNPMKIEFDPKKGR